MDKIITLSVKLNCAPMNAYQYFVDNSLLETWLTSAADVEPESGGKYELFWDLNNRENNSTIGCKITAVQPGKFISFEWRSPEQFKHFANQADPLTHVIVFFIPAGNGTEVHLVHSGWRSTPEWQAACAWQERAWNMAFSALERLVNER